jgi:hypothetical protein
MCRHAERPGSIRIRRSCVFGSICTFCCGHFAACPPCLQAHIWLNLIGWGFLIPVGIVIARSRAFDPFWFKAHRQASECLTGCMRHACWLLLQPAWLRMRTSRRPPAARGRTAYVAFTLRLSCRILQPLGLLLGIIGLGLGFSVSGGWDGKYGVHRNLGMAAVILGALQVQPRAAPIPDVPADLSSSRVGALHPLLHCTSSSKPVAVADSCMTCVPARLTCFFPSVYASFLYCRPLRWSAPS